MNKETKIAKKNIKWIKSGDLMGRPNILNVEKAKEHKQTCQRWLGFLEEINIQREQEELEEKITDLKQTIKLYEDAGIK